MISDEPDEDADTLDDDSLLENFLEQDRQEPNGKDIAVRGAGAKFSVKVQDWPVPEQQDLEGGIDDATLAWFKANHADWRLQMTAVLRAWVNSKKNTCDQP